MIQNIPSGSEFTDTGKMFLNMAWDIVSDLYFDIHVSEVEKWDNDGSVSDEFWMYAQSPLANATVLTQQGIEFLLKARIVEISPYLLLAGGPRNWPAKCDQNDTPFADFRTVDAQDLGKIHDTVCEKRLDPSFKSRIEEIRRIRNTLMHTFDRNMRISPTDIWKWILQASENLIGERIWLRTRRQYLEHKPSVMIYGSLGFSHLIWEALKLLDVLSTKEKTQFLGVDPKRRWYACKDCSGEYSSETHINKPVRTAQLRPAEPSSTSLYCFVCEREFSVIRVRCPNSACSGDVIDAEEGLCLTCFEACYELE